MAAIDVGPEATDRAGTQNGGYTCIQAANPADGTGTITSLEVWMNSNGVIKVGMFYNTSGTNYKCRSAITTGTITSGSKQTLTQDGSSVDLAMSVVTGDLLGVYVVSGAIEYQSSGAGGDVWISGDHVILNDESTYTAADGDEFSCKGIGVTAAAGWSNVSKVYGVTATDMSKLCGVAVASVSKICGVAV
jgi:hypothetical protein